MPKSLFSSLPFHKFEATGNDFIVLELPLPRSVNSQLKSEISRLCSLHFGVGADGLVWISKTKKGHEWRFFNKDGYEADLCGNAARAVAKLLLEKSRKPEV